jgi:hypothetical protein
MTAIASVAQTVLNYFATAVAAPCATVTCSLQSTLLPGKPLPRHLAQQLTMCKARRAQGSSLYHNTSNNPSVCAYSTARVTTVDRHKLSQVDSAFSYLTCHGHALHASRRAM